MEYKSGVCISVVICVTGRRHLMFAPWNCDQSTSGSRVNTALRSRTLRLLLEFSLVLRR